MNTLKRKLTAILLTFAMLFSLMPALPQAAEAAQKTTAGQYVTMEYKEVGAGVLEPNSIVVNVFIEGREAAVETLTVNDAGITDNHITINVNGSDYEIAGRAGVSMDASGASLDVPPWNLNMDLNEFSTTWTSGQGSTLTINLTLREPVGTAAEENGHYEGNATVEFRAYDEQIFKMLYLAGNEVDVDTTIDSVSINFKETFGEGASYGLTDINREEDYYSGTLSNASGKAIPANIESLTIQYNGGTVNIPAKDLCLNYHAGTPGTDNYYLIESNNDNVHIVYFYNEADSNTGNNYTLYAIRFVNDGESVGNEMPEDPTYNETILNQYKFVNWELESWTGDRETGEAFLPSTIVDSDINVFAHKVSSDKGGTQIYILNNQSQFLNRIAEKYNEENGTSIDASDIRITDQDGFGISVYEYGGKATTPRYADSGWADHNSYYDVRNYDAEDGTSGETYNQKVAFDQVAGIRVEFKTNGDETVKNVEIPVGNNAGDLAKLMDNGDNVLQLYVIQEDQVVSGGSEDPDPEPQPPAAPTEDELNALIDVTVDCESNEAHELKTYPDLLANSYTPGTVTENTNGTYSYSLTVYNGAYVEKYNNEYVEGHKETGETSAVVELVNDGNGWKLADGSATKVIPFLVTCDSGSQPVTGGTISDFEKDLIAGADEKAAAEKAGVDVENYYIPEKANQTVIIPYDGEVTLLYSITVTGSAENGKFVEFFITDDGATLIDTKSGVSTVKDQPGVFNGKLKGEDASITFYVSKTFNAEQLTEIEGETYLVNEASIKVKGEGAIETETEIDETVPAKEGEETDVFAVKPADITIYMGGVDGYDAVVGENGEILEKNTSLPEPGFTVQLPDELDGIDVKDLTFREKDGKRTWKFETYDNRENTTLYRLTPIGEGQTLTRVAFTNAAGEKIPSDTFEVGKEVNTSFAMTLYKGEGDTKVGDIVVSVNGKEYSVKSDVEGTLTVRGTTEKAKLANINNKPNNEEPAVEAENGTTYAINGGNVQVADTEGIALLFDEIIASDADSENNDRVDMLEDKANKVLEAQEDEMAYDFKYLDLVDSHNGNAWVQASEDVTIYWPLPEGTDADTDFTLLHFKDLHREMQSEEIQQKIENCDVETNATTGTSIEIVEVTDEYVVLKTGDTGFSPFALAWDADARTGTDYVVDSFDKTLVATAQDATAAGITNAESYNYPESGVVTIERGEDVTLLYKLTVTGNADGKFMVTDKGTSLVYPKTGITVDETNGTYTGIIGVDGITTFYVAKTFDAADITLDDQKNPVLVNSATIVADGDGDGTIDPGEEGGVTPGEEDKDEETDVTTEFTLTFEYDHAYALDANNKRIPEGQTITVDCGDDFDFTARPNSGYILDVPTIDGRAELKVNTSTNFTVENIISDVVVYVDATKQGGGIIVVPGGDDDDNPGDNDGPSGLNTEDHFSYVVGYEDGMVKPQRSITRAEVATIFYRLLEDDVRDDYDTTRNNFSDVTSDSWYNQTVSTLASMGILKGYEDGTFRPNASITRAEFAAIATRFFEETGATYEPGTFTDVTGSEWFAGAIMDAVNLGLIGGYEDGTVRPNNNITRAEACAIVNRTLGRVPDADHLLPADEMTTWPDNPSSAWFYADMQEATNGHEYEWITEDGNKIEEWTDILDKDWNDR